jgi:adenosine deaminase
LSSNPSAAREHSLLEQLQSQPKVDLHRHLEGSLRLDSLVEIINEYQLDLPSDVAQLRPLVEMPLSGAGDPGTLFEKFKIIREFFCDEKVISRFVNEIIEDAAEDNVQLLELRFTPGALSQKSNLPLAEVMDHVIAVGTRAAAKSDLALAFVVSVNRHESLRSAEEIVGLALERADDGIVGIDLAGDEQAFDAQQFRALFLEAKQAGLKLTIHAGEWGPPENVLFAIEEMQADRIGHGIRILEDASIIKLAREVGVGFEISPTSNLRTGVIANADQYPLSNMIELGLRIAITTDDPSIFNTNLSAEHALAVNHLGLSQGTLQGLTMQALQLSFIQDRKKRELEARFRASFWGGENQS